MTESAGHSGGGRSKTRRSRSEPRERYVALVGLLVLAVGLGNLVRAAVVRRYAIHLSDLSMTASWAYLGWMALGWGIVLIATAVGLLRFRVWGRIGTLVATSLYQIYVWVNHLVFDANVYALSAWPRELILTVLFLVVVWGVLCWPGVRRIFRS